MYRYKNGCGSFNKYKKESKEKPAGKPASFFGSLFRPVDGYVLVVDQLILFVVPAVQFTDLFTNLL